MGVIFDRVQLYFDFSRSTYLIILSGWMIFNYIVYYVKIIFHG